MTIRITPGVAAHVEGVYVERRNGLVAEMAHDVSELVRVEADGSYALAMPLVGHLLREHVEWEREDLVKVCTFIVLELARVHDGHPIVTREKPTGSPDPEPVGPEEKRLYEETRTDLAKLIGDAAHRIRHGEPPADMAKSFAYAFLNDPKGRDVQGLAGVAAIAIVECARQLVSYVDPS